MPVAVTLGAQVGVAIPSLARVRAAAARRLVANLLAVPVAGLVMLYGLPACLLGRRGPAARAVRSSRPSAGARGGSTPWPPSAPRPNPTHRGRGWAGASSRGARHAARAALAQRRCETDAPMSVHLLIGDDESIVRAGRQRSRPRARRRRRPIARRRRARRRRRRARQRRRRRPDPAVPHRAARRAGPRRRPVHAPTRSPRWSPTSPIRCRRTDLVLVGGGGRLAEVADRRRQAGRGHRALDEPAGAGRRPPGVDRRAGRRGGGAAVAVGGQGDRRAARRGRRPARRPAGHARRDVRRRRVRSGSTTSRRSSARPAACRRGSSPTPSTPATPSSPWRRWLG